MTSDSYDDQSSCKLMVNHADNNVNDGIYDWNVMLCNEELI